MTKNIATDSGAHVSKGKHRSQFMEDFHRYKNCKYLMLIFIPCVIWYVVFKYAPIYGLLIAFKDFKFSAGIMGSEWVGFSHFQELFNLPGFWRVFRNTIVISFYYLIFGFPAPIIFALMLNEIRQLHFKKVVQTISYLPHFLSWVVLAGMFTQFLSPSTGPINIALKSLGMDPIYFIADPKWFRTVLTVTNIWKSVGWGSIIYLAALTGVDVELYEAARIDGASRWKQTLYITLPAISGIIVIMLIFQAGRMVNDNFDQVFNLYNAAVYDVGDVLGTYTYRMGMKDMRYSLSTAVGLFKNVISFALVIFTNWIAKKLDPEGGIW